MTAPVAQRINSRLARRVIVYTILFSSTITLLLTSLQLYRTYTSDLRNVENKIHEIATTHLPSIIASLWATDTQGLQVQLDGILRHPDMHYLILREGEKTWAESGHLTAKRIIKQDFPLIYNHRGKAVPLGTLTTVATLDGIYTRLIDQAAVIVLSNGIKTFLVAGFMLWLLHSFVGRHLAGLSAFLRTLDFQGTALRWRLERPVTRDPDELDEIARSLESLIERQILAREELSASEQKFHSVFEQANDGILMIDLGGNILDANHQMTRFTGYTHDELIGKSILDITPTEQHAKARQKLKEVLNEKSAVFERDTLHRDGHFVSVEVSSRLVHLGENRVIVSIVRDLTQKKAIEAERQQIFAEIKGTNTRMRALSQRLVETQEAERQNLARELHDEVGQLLTTLKMRLQLAQAHPDQSDGEHVVECVRLSDELLSLVRSLSLNLRPPQLDDIGLAAALESQIQRVAPAAGFTVKLDTKDLSGRLPEAVELTCFRVAQEAIVNAAKYADARHINITVARHDGIVHLAIQDDGDGFDLTVARDRAMQGHHMGLFNMEERVALMNGQFEIISTPGQGTTIRASIPLPGVNPDNDMPQPGH